MRARSRFGIAIAAMVRMIATTINSSISEKPVCFARAHNFGAATRGPCRRTETQATLQKHKVSELAFAALWLCTLPRVLRRPQLLVCHREECLAARIATSRTQVAGRVNAHDAIFRRAEGLGAGLRTEYYGLGIELNRDYRPGRRDWNRGKAVAALTGANGSTVGRQVVVNETASGHGWRARRGTAQGS